MNNGIVQFSKSLTLAVKDIDTAGRRVQVALSKFGNVDSDGDVIPRGAFAKSIQDRGPESSTNRKIKFLRYHDFEHEVGKWVSLEETSEFLIGIGELGRSTKGNDAFLDYQDEIITEHSIGFISMPDRIKMHDDGIKELTEVFLMEGSAVTFGSNSETPVFSVSGKDQFCKEYLDNLNGKMNAITKALRSGEGTDERFERLSNQLKVIQSKYNSLINFAPLEQSAPDEDGPNSQEDVNEDKLKQFYLNQFKNEIRGLSQHKGSENRGLAG